MYKYKNKSENDLTLVGIGVVKAGLEFESPLLIENANIEIVSRPDAQPEPAPAPVASPADNNEEQI